MSADTKEIDINKLAEAVADRVRSHIPKNAELWDISMIAEYLHKTPSVVRGRIVVVPSFPKAIRYPTTQGRSHPLYKAKEVIAWAEKHQEKN